VDHVRLGGGSRGVSPRRSKSKMRPTVRCFRACFLCFRLGSGERKRPAEGRAVTDTAGTSTKKSETTIARGSVLCDWCSTGHEFSVLDR
jgi:hypothetical protein